MTSLIGHIKARLESDATLYGTLGPNGYSGLAVGGIWDKPLRREPPGATVDAFYTNNIGAKAIRNGVIVLVDSGDIPHVQRFDIPSAYTSVVSVFIYASATQTGKNAIEACRKRIWELLDHEGSNGWTFITDDGPIAFVDYFDRLGVQNSEDFPEAVFDLCHFRVTTRRANLV